MFVQGLAKPDKVCLSLQSVLFDFSFLCSFFNLLLKLRCLGLLLIKAAHGKARGALKLSY